MQARMLSYLAMIRASLQLLSFYRRSSFRTLFFHSGYNHCTAIYNDSGYVLSLILLSCCCIHSRFLCI